MNIVLVGECNPYGPDPRFALYDLPIGCAGWRLRTVVLGLSERSYAALARVNLCDTVWSLKAARSVAERLLETHDVLVLLGRNVSKAFGYDGSVFSWGRVQTGANSILVRLPHPSGRCREWNAEDSVPRARALLKNIAPSVPWGESEVLQE